MEQQRTTSIAIHCEMATKLNFACHQSSYAFLRDLRISSADSDKTYEDLIVTLSANPPFLKPKSWRFDRIGPNSTASVKDRDVELDGGFLLTLADSVRGNTTVTVEHDGQVIAEEAKPIELLAYNEWGGSGSMPELLAAFSMPNDPVIDRILHDASLILRRASKPDGIDGYKSKSRQRVWELASAIYAAICNLGISYAVPPVSFERDGQKIRLPGQILENRVATCLDTAMLFSAALEQAGLNPVVALPRGHAVVGVWLQPDELASIVIDDAETLRKRIQLKELILIETTFVTSHPAPPFSKAVAIAEESISPEKDDTFHAAVDIRRARSHRIFPLCRKSETRSTTGETDTPVTELPLEEAPPLPDFGNELEVETKPETPAGRLERWQRKLLDLSARNPLLNHKSEKTSLRLLCKEPGLLEDRLAEGARISIVSVPQPTAQGQDEELHRQRTGEMITIEFAREALERNQVLVNLPQEELARRAVEIYRKAQTALQEGGANTLYLALGFLLWKQKGKDDRRFRAPLILLPITLERKSVRSGIKMASHDDEPRFNTTLLEMLRKDFQIDIPGLDGPLPTDHSGIDVSGIFTTIRKAIKEAPGFEVTEDVVLGHFSFAKYLMWKDLVDRTDALRNNAVVRHLIDTPREPYSSDIEFVGHSEIDRQYRPSDLLTPLPADASQLSAIATADRGKDFIIIGPPGTGKSQTISNLIAHLLGKSKTVLFVSEKTAALEVVYRRLKDIGLGRFCLELHSNKARKADVLAQLRNAWMNQKCFDAAVWENEAERLRVLRDRLNMVVDRLHLIRRNGMTAHHAIGVKIRDEALATRVVFSWPSADQHDAVRLQAIREAVENLRVQAEAVGAVSNHPFYFVEWKDWSPQWENQIVRRASHLSEAAMALESACRSLLDTVGITVSDRSMSRLDALADLVIGLTSSYRKQTSFALEQNGPDRLDAIGEAASRLQAYASACSALSCAYEPMAWRKIDGSDIEKRWKEAEESWWPMSWFARRRVINDMRAAGAIGMPDPARDAGTLTKVRAEGEAIDRLGGQLSELHIWQGHTTKPDVMVELKVLGQRIRTAISRLAADAATLTSIRDKIRTLLAEGNDLLSPEAAVGCAGETYLKAHRTFHDAWKDFEEGAGRAFHETVVGNDKALEQIRKMADTITERHAELNSWCGWYRRRMEALDLELAPLVEAIEKGRIPIEEIETTFEASYCTWWSGAVIGEDDILKMFSVPEHSAAVSKFREIDSRFQKLTAEYIGAKLAGNLPAPDDITRKSTWGVLRHELQKKMKHKPVRQLVQEIPDVLMTLTPCLMMSPLSVAQYLPPQQALFDVVIFDEASQITVWDAVGALARGRQAIVAGDPKQMPPTNFFARSDDDMSGEIDIEGDLESILDEMLGASIPQRILNLHYRSRRESLIAFSNSRYYNNDLVTFPAPIHPDHGVRLVRPKGFYARGKSRHNEGEAKAIVSEILCRLTSDDPTVSSQSVGVVTFNSEQQTLIENLLDDARAKNPEIEWAFSGDKTIEPVFVKNLETVQGDERDVILFSITYGPDQSNHVTMNFGPLNRNGGERRLNVAMTRARSEMIVFSTLGSDQIDLSRTQAQAVMDLKHFLEYACRGPAALGAAVSEPGGDCESPFETAVARELRAKGWVVHPQVGVSAYRIDLGIVHPDAPGIYLAGVECDGAMYHSSHVARERDKIRQLVLEGLGWKLLRVWSTDWWVNRPKALEMLNENLTRLLNADRKQRDEAASVLEAQKKAEVSASQQEAEENTTTVSPPSIITDDDTDTSSQEPKAAAQVVVMDRDETQYAIADLAGEQYQADPGLFYADEYKYRLAAMIDHVIDTEGPIHEEVLVRRIARHHGFQRAGRQIRDIIIEIARQQRGTTSENVGLFFWPEGIDPLQSSPARYKDRNEEMRKAEYICKEELRAIDRLLALNGNAVEIGRSLGINRLNQSSRLRITETTGHADIVVEKTEVASEPSSQVS